MITYTVKQPNKDIYNAVIEKTGHALELTLVDVMKHVGQLTKMKKEAEGNIYVARAFKNNLEKNHPYIKKLDDKQLDTMVVYGQKRADEKDNLLLMNEIEAQIAKYKDLEQSLIDAKILPESGNELGKMLSEYTETVSEAKEVFNDAFNKSKDKKNAKGN